MAFTFPRHADSFCPQPLGFWAIRRQGGDDAVAQPSPGGGGGWRLVDTASSPFSGVTWGHSLYRLLEAPMGAGPLLPMMASCPLAHPELAFLIPVSPPPPLPVLPGVTSQINYLPLNSRYWAFLWSNSTHDSGSKLLSFTGLLGEIGRLICGPEIRRTCHMDVRLLAPRPALSSCWVSTLSPEHSKCLIKAPVPSDCLGQGNLSIPANQAP